MNDTTFIWPPHSGQHNGSTSSTRLSNIAHVWLRLRLRRQNTADLPTLILSLSQEHKWGGGHILQPWQLLLIVLASWVNRQQQEMVEYLQTENRVLIEKFGKRRILLSDDASPVKGQILGRKRLEEVGTLFTPITPKRRSTHTWRSSDRKRFSTWRRMGRGRSSGPEWVSHR